jgi:hypothetical protein
MRRDQLTLHLWSIGDDTQLYFTTLTALVSRAYLSRCRLASRSSSAKPSSICGSLNKQRHTGGAHARTSAKGSSSSVSSSPSYQVISTATSMQNFRGNHDLPKTCLTTGC